MYSYISIRVPIYLFLPLYLQFLCEEEENILKCALKYSGATSLALPKLNYFELRNFKMEVWIKVNLQIVECNHSARIFT